MYHQTVYPGWLSLLPSVDSKMSTNQRTVMLVSWSLTSPFSTNMAISETKGEGWKAIPTQWRKASDILTLTRAAFLFCGWKVTAGLAESNGSLPLGGWLIVTCGLTSCTLGWAPGPTLGNEYGKPLPYYHTFDKCRFNQMTSGRAHISATPCWNRHIVINT